MEAPMSKYVGRCGFYLPIKKRNCRMVAKEGEKYCAEHRHFDDANESINARKRIPCPLDPKHTIFEDVLKRHLRRCNAKEKFDKPYFSKGVNSGVVDYEFSDLEKMSLGAVAAVELDDLITRVNLCYEATKQDIKERLGLHSVLANELENPKYGADTLRQLKQKASLIKIVEEEGFLADGVQILEFGAGRGKLSHWLQNALPEGSKHSSFVLIDRKNNRNKLDCYHKRQEQGPSFERLFIDIEHLNLSQVDSVRSSTGPHAYVGKHLCGSATDLSLRCLMQTLHQAIPEDSMSPKKAKWENEEDLVLFALCCHHCCSWPSYVGKDFLRSHGFSAVDFHRMTGMSSWAVCSRRSKEHDGALQTSSSSDQVMEPMCNNEGAATVRSQAEKERIGWRCKRLIDQGRVEYLNEKQFTCHLAYYVTLEDTPENVVLVAKRNSLARS